MNIELSQEGSAGAELLQLVRDVWLETAASAGIDLAGFDPEAPLAERLLWAASQGLDVAGVLSRYSSKMQQSTTAQVRDCTEFAAWHRMYVPPEFVCVDEAVSGRKGRRDGLERIRYILKHKLARVLLVFKVSRLFRVAYQGFRFFQEDVVEEGLRAMSISQGIDTAEEKIWKNLTYLHGMMDEMLLTAIADHVRSGLKNLFQSGYVTGALTVGYRRVEVPGPLTKLGKPRTMPRVDPDVAKLIVQHFEWIRDGMSIKEGWRRWVAAGGPCDPRSSAGHMTYLAYRTLLSNLRLTGRWAFGRKRNSWSSKRDYTRQLIQPETEVVIYECDELRIVSDELFAAVQLVRAELKLGPRGPKRRKEVRLWDLVTDCFFCAKCNARFYQAGAKGDGMRCKMADTCPCLTVFGRQDAVHAVCQRLAELLQPSDDLIEKVVARAQEIDLESDDSIPVRIADAEKRIGVLTNKIDDLTDLVGQGTADERLALKTKVRAAQVERANKQLEVTRLRSQLERNGNGQVSSQEARAVLAQFDELLETAAAGDLGPDLVYRAAHVFRLLTGGRIDVHVERRAGRQRTNVRGTFRPQLLKAVNNELDVCGGSDEVEAAPESVWLREPPRLDALAERMHQLIDVGGHSFRSASEVLQQEGHRVTPAASRQIYERHYQMTGTPIPARPYNNGRPRKSA